MKLFQYIYYFFRSIKLRGLTNTFKLLYFERKYEKAFAINTHSIVNLDNLTLDGTHSEQLHHYQGASYFVLLTLFKKLPAHLKYKPFIDYGCGKGRALFVAEFSGFTNLIGVDIAKELIEQANQNKLLYKQTNPQSHINFYFQDATTYSIPKEAEVFYFFNPFGIEIMQKVINKIKESVQSNPRKIYCLYLNPLYRKAFDESDFKIEFEEKNKQYLEAVVYSFQI